jgi:bile acid-coenzyme A ligase
LPLHHGFGHSYAHQYGLAYGHCLVVQEHFDAEVSLRLIERWRVEFLATVPTALGRMARSTAFATADLSGVEALLHGAAPCPVPVKQAWMNRLGPQRVFEAYGATEVSIDCTIRGDEWLHRPGSVGRPFGCAIEIRAETGATQPTGEIGEIFVRPVDPRAAHPNIVGALAWASREARPTGDVGFVDNDGYLYVAGRSALQLVSGGITVHVEAVEATLTAHPEVRDAAVIAVQDDDLGEVPLALVCMEDLALAGPDDLLTWCRSRLASAQVPRSVQIVADLPHTPVGKLDRVRLRAMRTGSA